MTGTTTRCLIEATSGYIVAAVKPAISIRRGDVGEIAAKIRMSTAVHDTIGRFGIVLPSADAFIRAMPSALVTMNTNPMVVLVSERWPDERRYANIPADSAMPATSIASAVGFRGTPTTAGTAAETIP